MHSYTTRINPIGFYPLPSNEEKISVIEMRETRETKGAIENVLYVHIPFCQQRCSFCFFFDNLYNKSTWNTYWNNLILNLKLIRESIDATPNVSAVFIGGGSPNCMDERDISNLITIITQDFGLQHGNEVTMEWSPTERNFKKMQSAVSSGVTRFSIGVQTFNPILNKSLFKGNEFAEEAHSVIQDAVCSGADCVNIDLISCIPGETLPQLEQDICEAANCGIQSISINPLVKIPGTVLGQKSDGEENCGFSSRAELAFYTNAYLAKIGFQQQRFGNYHLPGKQHRYNQISSKPNCNLIGVGAGAYSYIGGIAMENHKDLKRYAQDMKEGYLPTRKCMTFGKDERKRSYVVSSLLEMGVSGQAYRNSFGICLEDDFRNELNWLVTNKYLINENGEYQMTDKGRVWGDNICLEFYSEQQRRLLDVRFNRSDDYYHHYGPC